MLYAYPQYTGVTITNVVTVAIACSTFSSSGDAIRVKGLRERPRASIAYFEGERFLINAHGHAELMFQGHPDVGEIDAIFRAH